MWIENETGNHNIWHGLKLHSVLVGYSDEGMAGWLDWPKKIGIWTIFNI